MRLGFIGAGNMAKAIIGGVLRAGLVPKEEIIASAATKETLERVKEEYGICTTLDNKEAAGAAIVFIAVKPVFCDAVLEEIKEQLTEGQIIVSIVAGRTLDWFEERLGTDKKIIRTMPNTPALVGEAVTAVCENGQVTQEERDQVLEILESFGEAQIIPERLMDAVVAVSGSSPAYVFMFIEAMADAAVAEGMPRVQAYRFAAQAVLGSAKMVLDTGKHPAELKDMVCSPAGTTIDAVKTLEEKGFRSAVMEAMHVCAEKSRNL